MKCIQRIILFVFCFSLYFMTTNQQDDDCSEDSTYVIRASSADLAVDITDLSSVKLQATNNNSIFQTFQFQCGSRIGLYRIVNPLTGLLLTITSTSPHVAVMSEDEGSLFQEWILNSKGNIFNAGRYAGLYPENGNVTANVNLVTRYNETDVTVAEEFILVNLSTRKVFSGL